MKYLNIGNKVLVKKDYVQSLSACTRPDKSGILRYYIKVETILENQEVQFDYERDRDKALKAAYEELNASWWKKLVSIITTLKDKIL